MAIVSVVAVAVPTAAMIIVLSLHNGLQNLVENVFGDFDSELKITPQKGQYFAISDYQLSQIEEFASTSLTLETNAILQWEGYSSVAVLRGVDDNYTEVNELPSTIKRGVWLTRLGEIPRGVLGAGVSYNLAYSIGMGRPVNVSVMLPTPELLKSFGVPLIKESTLEIAGIFTVDATVDSRYVFTDIEFVRELTGLSDAISSIELRPNISNVEATRRIQQILSSDIKIENKKEQRAMMYSTIEAEKVMIYFALLLVALIAAMSLAGCSLMMTTEKAHSASVLRSLGMTERKVRALFVRLSMLVVVYGVAAGVAVGVGIVAVQYYFEPLKMAGEQLIVDSYPVLLSWVDLTTTVLSVLGVGFLIVWFTTRSVNFDINVAKYEQ